MIKLILFRCIYIITYT